MLEGEARGDDGDGESHDEEPPGPLEGPALSRQHAGLDGRPGVVGVAPDGDPEQGPRRVPRVEGLRAPEMR